MQTKTRSFSFGCISVGEKLLLIFRGKAHAGIFYCYRYKFTIAVEVSGNSKNTLIRIRISHSL